MWDELLERHPDIIIDNCAAGGRMIDLETMRRSVTLSRSDYMGIEYNPAAFQCQGYGLSHWVPLNGTIAWRPNTYAYRSDMNSSLLLCYSLNRKMDDPVFVEKFPYEWTRKMLEQHLAVRKYYYGDFYPLTDYSLEQSVWLAYQMHRPDLDEGLVLAFRREENDQIERHFRLSGLNEDATYKLRFIDTNQSVTLTGGELMKAGFTVTINEKPGSALMVYASE